MKLTRKQLRHASVAADMISSLEETKEEKLMTRPVTIDCGGIGICITTEMQLQAIDQKLSEARDVLAKLGIELVPEVKS